MLSGKTFSMYIHSNEAKRKSRPPTANCQSTRTLLMNLHDQLKACSRIMAIFIITCPPASRALCNIANGSIFHIIPYSIISSSEP